MLPKSRKISRHDWPTDPRQAFVVHTEHLSLRYTPKNVEKPRFSAVIAKKVVASSPKRHLWKRRIYEIIRVFEKKEPVRVGLYCFFAKKDAHMLSYKALMVEVDTLLSKYNV